MDGTNATSAVTGLAYGTRFTPRRPGDCSGEDDTMKQPYLKRYKVTWRDPKYGRQYPFSGTKAKITLAKSADAARNKIKKDFGIPKCKQAVENIGG